MGTLKQKLLPFYELSRMNSLWGAMLLMMPSMWSLSLSYNNEISLYKGIYFFLAFGIGSILMRGFGCVINDILDVKIDKKTKRTFKRPIADGRVSIKGAIIFMGLLLIIPALILVSFNNFAKLIAVSSLLLVFLYPLSKRFIHIPQLILGLTFNWGILLADAVMNGTISKSSILLYCAAIFWTLIYDTVYAYQDYKDDIKNKVKSFAVLLGNDNKIVLLYLVSPMLWLLVSVGIVKNMNILYYFTTISACIWLTWTLFITKYSDAKSCFRFFKHNVYFALAIYLAIILGTIHL